MEFTYTIDSSCVFWILQSKREDVDEVDQVVVEEVALEEEVHQEDGADHRVEVQG